ncbi:MAG: ABC transporter permease subunit [Dehalococcoidales bacterium]
MNKGAEITPLTRLKRPFSLTTFSLAAFLALAIASWSFIIFLDNGDILVLFSTDTWVRVTDFIGKLAGEGTEGRIALFQLEEWARTGKLAYDTLAMSILAISFAGVGVLLTFLPAASNIAFGELAPSRSPVWRVLFFTIRGVYMFTRAIPDLIWAMLIIFFLSPGILAGALALGLHNYGILGKLSAEIVEDMDPRPARALRAAGAGNFQMLAYGIMPQVLPKFFTYLLYRWEVVIRTTVVVGFVGAGGLGREFRLALSWFHYDEVALLLVWYLLLVIAVDLLCAYLRRLAR